MPTPATDHRKPTWPLVLALSTGTLALLVSCGGGGPSVPSALAVAPLAGSPGTVLTISGLELTYDEPFEVWLGDERAPASVSDDGTLAVAVPLFLGEDGWPAPPFEPQIVEVRRGDTVLGRSDTGVTVSDLPMAPGSTQQVQAALADINGAYETLFSLVPLAHADQAPIREGVVAMLRGLVSDGEASLQAVLEGTSPQLEGAAADTELIDALLASSGALAYFEAYAASLRGAQSQVLRSQSSAYCRGEGADFELACQMQIYVMIDDYARTFVAPTAEKYANTVGLTAGLLAMGTVTVPATAIIGAVLSVADFVMEKVAPALFPSQIAELTLHMPRTTIEVGEMTDSRIVVVAANDPPQITYLDVFEQVKTAVGLKNVDFNEKFDEALKATAEYTLDLYLSVVKTYAASHPGTHEWATAGDLSIPAMTWGPVDVVSSDLVTLFSFDEAVVQSLENDLEWRGVELGEATVRVMPRGPGERSKVFRDHALCLGCVYSGGAFGNDMPESSATIVVGDVLLTATPDYGTAPLPVTFGWTGIEPRDEPVTCVLDVGDGTTPYIIEDCAHTTSHEHTYLYTSMLDSVAGVYEAELTVAGSDKTTTTDVMIDWTFGAAPAQGEPPLNVTYTWRIPYPADGGTLRCTLDPGDGSDPYEYDDCRSTTTASHSYAAVGSYAATLTVATAYGIEDSKTVSVTVADTVGDTWVGTTRATWNLSNQIREAVANVTWRLDPEHVQTPGLRRFIPSGTGTVTLTDLPGDTCVFSGTQTKPIVVEYGAATRNFLTVNQFDAPGTYFGYAGDTWGSDTPFQMHCFAGPDAGEYEIALGTVVWLAVPFEESFEVSADGRTIEGSRTSNGGASTSEWHFELVPGVD